MNKNKDRTGDGNSIYKTLGASNHTDEDREINDFYATDPIAIDVLCNEETFEGKIWECSCGKGHLSKRLIEKGYKVYSSDLIDRGYGKPNIDFLKIDKKIDCNIITNPPYKYAVEFIYESSGRILCAKNGEFQKMKDGGGSAVAYAWYVWEKGHTGNTIVKWVN